MPYVVQFELNGVTQAARALRAYAKAAREAAEATGRLKDSASRLPQIPGGGGGGRGGGGNSYYRSYTRNYFGGGGRGGGGAPSNRISGPFSQQSRAQSQWAWASQNGSTTQVADAMFNLNKANSRVANLHKKKPNAFMQAIMTSRIGVGADGIRIMPIIGRLVGALGELGPVGIAAAVAVAALGASLVMFMKAVQYGVKFGGAMYVGGGSASQTSQLASIGAGFGMDVGTMAGQARAYNDFLTKSPLANAYAQQHGFGANYVGQFGSDDAMNDTKRYIAGLKDMLFNPDSAGVRRRNYGGPLEGMEWARNASPEVKKSLLDSERYKQTPAQLQNAANAQIRLNQLQSEFQQLIISFANSGSYQELMAMLHGLRIFIKWIDSLNPFKPKTNTADAQAKANQESQDRHTDAMNNHSRALDNQRHVINGGERANSRIPTGYYGGNSSAQTRGQIGMGQIPV